MPSWNRLQRLGKARPCAHLDGLGLSETSSGTHLNPLGKPKIGSFGVPMPNITAGLMDPDTGEFVGIGEIGELVVKGPSSPPGTGKTLERRRRPCSKWTARSGSGPGIWHEWMRKATFIFYDRKRISSSTKGTRIRTRGGGSPEIPSQDQGCGVIGVPDPSVGANIKAAIVTESDARGKLSEEDVIEYCKQSWPTTRSPDRGVQGEIPKTDVGKAPERS